MKAGVFFCDNGLGHVRRAVIIANELSHFLNVFLIGDKKKIKKFYLRKPIKIKNFNLNFSPEKRYLKKGYIFKKLKNRCIHLYLNDEKFKTLVDEVEELTISGSSL